MFVTHLLEQSGSVSVVVVDVGSVVVVVAVVVTGSSSGQVTAVVGMSGVKSDSLGIAANTKSGLGEFPRLSSSIHMYDVQRTRYPIVSVSWQVSSVSDVSSSRYMFTLV